MGGPRAVQAREVPVPPAGLQEVTVLRLADPVQIRRAGASGAFPLPVYAKRERVTSGAVVITGAGGRAELLWPVSGSSVILFNEGACSVGEPDRGEATVTFLRLTRARMHLAPTDRIELLGGAVLRSLGEARSGPFLVELVEQDVMRVKNQTKVPAVVAVREELIELSPGQLVDVPLLSAGVAPRPVDPDLEPVPGPLELSAKGALESQPLPSGTRLEARGANLVRGLGIDLALPTGEVAVFTPLRPPQEGAAPAPAPAGDETDGASP